MTIHADLLAALNRASSGTVTTMLLGKGVRRCAMRCHRPLGSQQPIVGPPLRFPSFRRGKI
jgi:hypothetical protein